MSLRTTKGGPIEGNSDRENRDIRSVGVRGVVRKDDDKMVDADCNIIKSEKTTSKADTFEQRELVDCQTKTDMKRKRKVQEKIKNIWVKITRQMRV